jgi:superfamily II DNA helicase RecQ
MLFAFPEMLKEQVFLDLLGTDLYQKRLRFIFIDEVDCVTWRNFRPSWALEQLILIRGFLPDAIMCTLTATMPKWHYDIITEKLGLEDCIMCRVPQARTNHYFEVHTRPGTWDEICRDILDPLVVELRDCRESTPRILIYCNDFQLQMHADIYSYLTQQLGPAAVQLWNSRTRPRVS